MASQTGDLRVVLIGKTGNGKSSTGNSLLLSKGKFKAERAARSITKNCSADTQNYEIDGRTVRLQVVDTPGFFDPDPTITNDEIKKKIASEIFEMTSPGVHAFLIVTSVGRFTPEEADTVQLIQDMFGQEADRYCLMIITKKDELDEDGKSPDDFIRESTGLKQLCQRCSQRFFAMNNKLDGERLKKQNIELVRKIREMVKNNGNSCYTNEKYKEIERKRREAEQKKKDEERRKKEAAEKALADKIRKEEQEKFQERERQIREEERRNAQRYRESNTDISDLLGALQSHTIQDRHLSSACHLYQSAAPTYREPSAHGGRFTGEFMSTNGSANGRPIYEGSRGGQYYMSSGGHKQYLGRN